MKRVVPRSVCIVILAITGAVGQDAPLGRGPRQSLEPNPALAETTEEPEDLKQMRRTKWVVTSVQRDGKTVPAQYGQRVGDVIEFKMDDSGKFVLG